MAKVFKISKAINQPLREFLAAFHKATPFQGKVQAKIKNKKFDLLKVVQSAYLFKFYFGGEAAESNLFI